MGEVTEKWFKKLEKLHSQVFVLLNRINCHTRQFIHDKKDADIKQNIISGSYNPKSGSESSDACIDCKKGFACPTTGISVMTDALKCSPGYYCQGTETHLCTPS